MTSPKSPKQIMEEFDKEFDWDHQQPKTAVGAFILSALASVVLEAAERASPTAEPNHPAASDALVAYYSALQQFAKSIEEGKNGCHDPQT